MAASGVTPGAVGDLDPVALDAVAPSNFTWIYRDALAPAWSDWSWATRQLRNRRPVAAGRYSLSASFGPWQGLYFAHGGLAASSLEAVSLRVHGGSSGTGATLRVRAIVNGQPTAGADLGAHCAAGKIVANAWTTCTVPFAQLAPEGSTITGLQIQEFRGGQIPTVYFDELGLRLRMVEPTDPTVPTTPSIAVSVSPTAASLPTGGQQPFTATVTNASDARVTWSVQEAGGGTIDATGRYTAPSTAGTYHVIATSVADPSRRATASVTVTATVPPPPLTVSVAVSPTALTLDQGATARFTATVANASSSAVTWSVREGAAGGSVDASGLYTAPRSSGSFHVVATSVADPTARAEATVSVRAVAVSVSPLATTVEQGLTHRFTATVTGAADTAVTWSVQEADAGAIDGTGVYTAPARAGTFHVTATSRANTAASATALVTVPALTPTEPPPATPVDQSILPTTRRDTWNPGIPGGIPTNRRVFTTLSGLTTDGRGDNAGAINQAILNAHQAYVSSGVIQEVVLPAGTIRTASTITLNRSGVVLRGQGMDATRIRYDGTGDAFRLGRSTYTDYVAAHGPWYLQADGVKGSREIVLSNADATKILVGDILGIDQEDDTSYVQIGDATYDKRQTYATTHGPVLRGSGLYRSVTSMIGVVGKSVGSTNTTLTLAEPLHMNFRRAGYAQVFQMATEYSAARPQLDGVHYAGLEDLYFTGGILRTNNVAYCWIKNVEADGNPGTWNVGSYTNQGGISGRTFNLFHAYRCEVRGSYIHHSRNIVQGGNAYLVNFTSYTSETLFEDNIVVYGNKLIVGNVMGGGNVIAYNYVDNARTNHASWQETAIDVNHAAFTHSALVEGNWATNLVTDNVHGNAGWHVFLRNFGTGQNSDPIYGAYPYISSPDGMYRRAAGPDGNHREMTYVGNVLHAGTGTRVYQVDNTTGGMGEAAAVWRIGWGANGSGSSHDGGASLRLLYRHGNWDNVTNGVVWDSANTNRTIPASFYLKSKPAFFGSNPWPWVNPLGTTAGARVGILPAKARFDAMN